MRARAIAYVAGLVASYRSALKSPHLGHVGLTFYHSRIKALTLELALLQGSDGESRAQMWAKVAPL